jgi:hypothetical protein
LRHIKSFGLWLSDISQNWQHATTPS